MHITLLNVNRFKHILDISCTVLLSKYPNSEFRALHAGRGKHNSLHASATRLLSNKTVKALIQKAASTANRRNQNLPRAIYEREHYVLRLVWSKSKV